MGFSDLYGFAQAIWPCIQKNYPALASGATQIIGSASILYALFKKFEVAPGQPSSGLFRGLFGHFISLIGRVGLSK